jgi:hypothetical protein
MTDDPERGRIIEQNRALRSMGDADRRAAIDAAPNVFGFSRFIERARKVQLRNSYRNFRPDGGVA